MTFKNNTEFAGYLIIADDMVILPERIKHADKSSIWASDEIHIASLKTGKLVEFFYNSSISAKYGRILPALTEKSKIKNCPQWGLNLGPLDHNANISSMSEISCPIHDLS